MAPSDHPDPQVRSRDRDVPYYQQEVDNLHEGTRKLLQEWSGVPADKVEQHVFQMRERAWEVFPYPCIGQWRFLDLSVQRLPEYPEILERIHSGQKYLDIGCCFGQDIRKLAYDGAPTENLYGSDLRQDFMDLGYELFLDKDKLKSKFIAGDIFDENSALKDLNGDVDIIHAASFFHLFGWDDQLKLKKRCVSLLKPQKGSLLVGRQVGNIHPGEKHHRTNPNQTMWRHDGASFKQMWEQVGRETGTEWDIQAELIDAPGFFQTRKGFGDEGQRQLRFSVRRL